ncbi:aminotransferase class I/II-fold pyridoxal phosphate-dependent enzyme [Candidatus Vidania fulgoroideae]|uniref:Aminotransferase class I/II-fold pyridoxal phosphate-dependent enzyme n=1 Tax=Candidatus Vidania fulgoroideorum TaxID=881286 RepID=A0A974X718_9PROT|nr:aminotransferase class I/II-fold pyridoxal phosphate-dependent enzyme [Candidatus Vidania fulgoroideae]
MVKIYLNKMEFPFTFISEIINKYTHTVNTNTYPTKKDITLAKTKILSFLKLKKLKHKNLIIGNGSDELISLLIATTANKHTIGFFTPTFTMYKKYCESYNKNFTELHLNNFKLNKNSLKKIKQCKIFFICNPNNPNGNTFNKQQLLKLITTYPKTYFVIDEAYAPYSKSSLVNQINCNNNLIILKTLSKIGFAGNRLGIMISNQKLITKYTKHKSPYNIGSKQIETIHKVLTKNLYKLIQIGINRIHHTKHLVTQKLQALKTIHQLKSKSNFILITNNTNNPITYKNIKIKTLTINNLLYQRISIGKVSDMLIFLKTIFKNEKRLLFRKKNPRK